jgi:SNF2 family DNA or RNA helicase
LRTYGRLSYLDETKQWSLEDLEPHVCIKLKAVFPTVAKGKTSPFYFPDRPEIAADLYWFLQRYPLLMEEHDRAYLETGKMCHLDKINQLEQLLRPDYQPNLFKMKGELRPYQAQAVDLYLANKMLLIGDDVGLGKTLCGIGSWCVPQTLPAALVVQTHLPKQWTQMIAQFTELKVHVIKGTKPYQLPPADIYIFKYSNISGWVDTFQMKIFKSVVYDEVQELRRCDSNKYSAARKLSKSCEYVLGLSATPIYNYGDEIYNILDMLKEDCLGDRTDFLREWGGGGDNKIKNPVALGSYLRENFFFLRRTRGEVGRELPPVNVITHTVESDAKTVQSVEELAHTLAVRVTTGEFVDRGLAARELNILVRQMTGVAKAKAVANYVKVLLENGEPVLLAGWHRDVYDIWLEELKDFKPLMYTGTESPTQKEATKQAFIKGDSNLMIISLRSGVGLDGLQERCSIVVIGELDWSPQVMKQVIGRVDRDGQKIQTTAIYLLSEEGSDPLMVDLLGLKSSQSHGIINPFETAQPQHTDESRIKLLAQRYIDKRKAQNGDGTLRN